MNDEYVQSDVVVSLHLTPRFGHSNDISNLVSLDYDEQVDYLQGILSFSFFLFVLFAVWMTALGSLKYLGHGRVGCAAGGDEIDIRELRKTHKPILRKIITRSWRVQSIFFVACTLLPIATIFLLTKGINTLVEALEDIQSINTDIERVTHRAVGITNALLREGRRIDRVGMDDLMFLDSYCPNVDDVGLNFEGLSTDLQMSLEDMTIFLDDEVTGAQTTLFQITDVTQRIDTVMDFALGNDWIPKMIAMFLNVINGALFLGLVISRNNCVFYPYKCMLVFLLVPAFTVLMFLSIGATSGFGIAAAVNADFCAGGPGRGSPEGTIKQIFWRRNITENDLTYQSFQYYMDGCSTENPLAFATPYRPRLRQVVDQTKTLLFSVGELGVDNVTAQCGNDVGPLIETLQRLVESLEVIEDNIEASVQLSDCSNIGPILKRILHGATCDSAIEGMAWTFVSMLSITTLGMIILSVRAALYNATIRPAKRDKESAREKEWREYREFMSKYYEDAMEWKYHPSPESKKKKKKRKSGAGIETVPSFGTEVTGKPSMDEEDSSEGSVGGRFVNETEMVNMFITPHKSKFLEEVRRAEKLKDLVDVMDEELTPLSPPVPMAPKKPFQNFQRTTQRKVLC